MNKIGYHLVTLFLIFECMALGYLYQESWFILFLFTGIFYVGTLIIFETLRSCNRL